MRLTVLVVLLAGSTAYAQPTTKQRLARIEARKAGVVAQPRPSSPNSLAAQADLIEQQMGFVDREDLQPLGLIDQRTIPPMGREDFLQATPFTPARDGPAGLGLGQGQGNLSPDVTRRLQRGIPVHQRYHDYRDSVRPIRHDPPAIPTGPTRFLAVPGGGSVPDYTIPYGRRGNYKFVGVK